MKHEYKKEYCKKIIEMAKISGKPVQAFSAQIGVPYSIILKWSRDNPEFAEAFELAASYFLDYWLDKVNEILSSLNVDNPLLNIAKSNIDRYYKDTATWYGKPDSFDDNQDGDLSTKTGSSLSY